MSLQYHSKKIWWCQTVYVQFMDIHASLSPTNCMNAVKCATCSSSMWAGWSKFGGSHQTESLVSFCFSVYWKKKSVCKKNWRQVKKSQTATEEVHTHASAQLCDMQTGSENRAMAQNKGQCFSLSCFDAQIRRQEFRFLLENIVRRERKTNTSAEWSSSSRHKSSRCHFWTGSVAFVKRKYTTCLKATNSAVLSKVWRLCASVQPSCNKEINHTVLSRLRNCRFFFNFIF